MKLSTASEDEVANYWRVSVIAMREIAHFQKIAANVAESLDKANKRLAEMQVEAMRDWSARTENPHFATPN